MTTSAIGRPAARLPDVASRPGISEQTTTALRRTLEERGRAAVDIDGGVASVIDGIADLAAGGKRVRATLCYYGWLASDARDDEMIGLIGEVGVALELFHLGALIHDDIMDAADMRRGVPTIHSRMASRAQGVDAAIARRFGHSTAILAGDLCFGWAAGTFTSAVARHREFARACAMFDAMRSELMVGQYLDIASDVSPTHRDSVDRALKVARIKTARYSIDFPIQIGAFLGFADDRLRAHLSTFAVAIGEAYQLRDDLLGAFGFSPTTGKSGAEDLVNAKNTALWCETRGRASESQLAQLDLLANGDTSPGRIENVRAVMTETGAVRRIEELIDERYCLAAGALAAIPSAPPELSALAYELVYRNH